MRWMRLILILGLLVGLVVLQAVGQNAPAIAQDRPAPSSAVVAPGGAGSPAVSAAAAPAFAERPATQTPAGESSGPAAPSAPPFGSRDTPSTQSAPAQDTPAQSSAPAVPSDAGAAPVAGDAGQAAGATPEMAGTAAPTETEEKPWVTTHRATELWSDSESGTSFGRVRQWTYLQLTEQAADGRLYVFNPRTENFAWVDAEAVGPSGPPPDTYLRAPQVLHAVQRPGRVVGGFNLRSWPAVRDDTLLRQLGHNAPLFVQEAVVGEDGETWYRVGDDEYVHASGVRLPKAPPRTFSGKWIDVDLNEPAMIAAYDGDRLVHAALTIKGTRVDPTPAGVYRIQRRVANETMDSATVGIPRNSPRGYYLRNVLYTQYFTSSGASIHYNYWSSVFGYAGSHGCLGLTLDDARWFWDWAGIGTTLHIHY